MVGATGGLGGGDGGKGAVGCVLRGWLVFVGRHGVGLLSEKIDGDEARYKEGRKNRFFGTSLGEIRCR